MENEDKSRSNAVVDDKVGTSEKDPTFLSMLRTKLRYESCFNPGSRMFNTGSRMFVGDPGLAVRLIVRYQSEFPGKIRETIQEGIDEARTAPGMTERQFYERVHDAVEALFLTVPNKKEETTQWNGLDSEVDTEDEVEVAIRTFPGTMKACRTEGLLKDCNALICLTTSLKAMPFVPLFAKIDFEFSLCGPRISDGLFGIPSLNQTRNPLEELVRNDLLRHFDPRLNGEKYDRQIDETSLSVLSFLLRHLINYSWHTDAWSCILALLHDKPSRTELRFRFLLDLCCSYQDKPKLLFLFFDGYKNDYDPDQGLERFRAMLETLLSDDPKKIGHLFYKRSRGNSYPYAPFEDTAKQVWYGQAFQIACKLFGKEKVSKVVHESISKVTRGRPYVVQNLIYAAAADENMEVDALYFLCRHDPTMLLRGKT